MAAAVTLGAIAAPAANANYYFYTYGDGTRWEWDIDDNAGDTGELNDVDIQLNGEDLNTDAYDGTGNPYVDEIEFDADDLVEEDTVDGSYSYSYAEEDGTSATMTVTITGNNVTYTLTAANANLLEIYYNVGSDEDSTFTTLDGKFISYEAGGANGPDNDPIIYWVTDGTITYEDGEDTDFVSTNSNSLTLKHYIYAHDNDSSLSTEEYLNLFIQWVNENVERMDVFTPAWRPSATVSIKVRPTANLTFAESQFGSDLLSDPTGELRRLVDRIMNS